MENKKFKKRNRRELKLWLIILFLLVAVVGGNFNYTTIISNNCRMPVYTAYPFNDSTHFSFLNKSSVNHFYFSDIISISSYAYFSIGDILVYMGGGLVFLFLILYWREVYRDWNETQKTLRD